MKFTITIDCDEKGNFKVWSQEKENMKKEDTDRKRVLEAKVKLLIQQYQQKKELFQKSNKTST